MIKNYGLAFFMILVVLAIAPLAVDGARQTIITKSNEFRIDLIRYDPSPMIPGKSAELWFEISNLKDKSLDDLRISFVDVYPFSIQGDSSVNIVHLDPGKTQGFKFTVTANENAPAGSYKPGLQFYSPTIGMINSETITLKIQNPPTIVTLTDVKTEPDVAIPGGSVNVGILLTNTYTSRIRDISLKFDLTNATYFAPSSTTTEANIKTLEAGEQQRVNFGFLVSPNAPADVYKIPFTLSYTDESGTSTTKTAYVGISVNAPPVYSIYIEDLAAFEKNTPGKVVLSISNVGPVDIKYLTLRILDSDSYDIISKSQIYIGNLKPDDYQTGEFNIYRKDNGPLKALVQYKDIYSNDYSKVEDLDMKLFTKSQAEKYGLVASAGYGSTIAMAIIILLLIWVVFEWVQHKSLKTAINYVFLGVIAGAVDIALFFRPSNLRKRYREVREHIKKKEQPQ